MIRLALFLFSAVIAGIIFAFSIELPEPKPIDPNNMLAVEVVAPREPVPEAGEIMDVGKLSTGYVHRPHSASPAPVYDHPPRVPHQKAPRPPVRVHRPETQRGDPLHYRRYVQENVRRPPPPSEYDPDPYRDRPRVYYYVPPEPRREPPRAGCNAMASWCDDRPRYYQNRENGNNERISRAPNETRGRMPENRGEDFFE